MTFVEVRDEIAAYRRRRENERRESMQLRAAMDYRLGDLIRVAFNDPNEYPKTLKEAYPGMFKESSDGVSWQTHKNQFKRYAEEFNRQREAKQK